MGIGGLDSEFSAIFRRAFASRVFPPGLVDKLGIQHVKGRYHFKDLPIIKPKYAFFQRYSAVRTSRNRKDSHGSANREDAQLTRAQDR